MDLSVSSATLLPAKVSSMTLLLRCRPSRSALPPLAPRLFHRRSMRLSEVFLASISPRAPAPVEEMPLLRRSSSVSDELRARACRTKGCDPTRGPGRMPPHSSRVLAARARGIAASPGRGAASQTPPCRWSSIPGPGSAGARCFPPAPRAPLPAPSARRGVTGGAGSGPPHHACTAEARAGGTCAVGAEIAPAHVERPHSIVAA